MSSKCLLIRGKGICPDTVFSLIGTGLHCFRILSFDVVCIAFRSKVGLAKEMIDGLTTCFRNVQKEEFFYETVFLIPFMQSKSCGISRGCKGE